MRSFARMSLGLGLALALSTQVGCTAAPGESGTGGSPGSGGTSSSGGTSATGGTQSSGGTSGSGGVSATGGSSASGGSVGTGGSTSSGGSSGSGGSTVGRDAAAGGGAGGAGAGGASGGGQGTGGKGTAGQGTGGTSVGGQGTGGKGNGGVTGNGGATGSGGATGNGGSTGNGGATGDVYNPDFKEFYGEDCVVPDPKDVKISGQLPDLFTMADGTTKMSKKSDWRCQRAYLKKVVEKYIHGTKPGTPDKVTGTVSSSAIKVNVEHGGKSISFSVSVSGVPSGSSGPVPIIIGMGGSSLDAAIVKAEGVASGNFDHQGMASETSGSGLFSNIYGSTGAAAQIGWAWGISRVIDVLVAERDAGRNNIIDPTAVGVTGCSRNGKAAFTVGAFDERIALGIPQESGTGGVSAFRIVNTNPKGPNNMNAQTLDSACSEAKGWFGNVFCTNYKGKVDTIPGDTSTIAAMYAPRGLLVLDNSRIGELCSTCQHAAVASAAKVYEALGVGKNAAYNGGNPSDPHNHCTFYSATQGEPLKRAIRAHLTKKAAADGRLEPQPAGTADLAKWVPWTAPTLADDMSFASPPVTSK